MSEEQEEEHAVKRWVEDMGTLWSELFDLTMTEKHAPNVSVSQVMSLIPQFLALESVDEEFAKEANHWSKRAFVYAAQKEYHLVAVVSSSGGWLMRCMAQLANGNIKEANVSGRECLALITRGMQLAGVPMEHVRSKFEAHNQEYKQRIASEAAKPKQ